MKSGTEVRHEPRHLWLRAREGAVAGANRNGNRGPHVQPIREAPGARASGCASRRARPSFPRVLRERLSESHGTHKSSADRAIARTRKRQLGCFAVRHNHVPPRLYTSVPRAANTAHLYPNLVLSKGPGTLSPLTQAPIGNAEKQIPQIDAVSGFEDVHVHRFTDDGRYLICFSRNQHDLVVYRFKGFGAEPLDDAEGATEGPPVTPSRRPRAGATTEPQTENDKTCEKQRNRTPSPATTRDLYFQLQYQRPLTVDADLLARDFAVTVLDGDYLLLASSTPAEAPPRGDHATAERSVTPGAGGNGNPSGANAGADTQGGGGGGGEGVNESDHASVGAQQLDEAALAARASGALAVQRAREEAEADTASRRGAGRPNATTTLPGSPTMDTVALHLVRLSDGKVCDRRVYRDDYVRLRRAAAVSVHRETNNTCLVSVLSLRWQAFRMLRIVRRKGETERAGRVDEIPGQTTENETETLDNSGAPLYTDDLETAVFTDARSPVGAACEPDDDAPLAAQDAAEREWRLGALADDDGSRQNGASGSAEPSTSGHRDVGGWSDPESHMYAGIKQKLMTRVLLEARRRDAAEAAETADRVTTAAMDCIPTTSGHETNTNSSRGVKRSREDPVSSYVPSVSAPLSEKETMLAAIRNTYSDNGVVGTGGSSTPISSKTPTKTKEKTLLRRASFSKPKPPAPRNAFTSAFFSRYWSYAEWMVLWHVQLLDGVRHRGGRVSVGHAAIARGIWRAPWFRTVSRVRASRRDAMDHGGDFERRRCGRYGGGVTRGPA